MSSFSIEKVVKQGDVIKWKDLEFSILSPNEINLKNLLKNWDKKVTESILDTSRKNNYKKTLKELIEHDVFEEDKRSI